MPSRPLLFMRTGTHMGAPDGFSARLAEAYDAQLISTDLVKQDPDVQEEIGFKREQATSTPTHSWKDRHSIASREWYKEEMDALTTDALNAGTNVVYNQLLNETSDRGRVYEVARSCGARTVLLAMLTPREVALERINERHPNPGSKQKRAVKQLDFTERQLRQGGWPRDREKYVLLNGADSIENMLAKIATYVETEGIYLPDQSTAA